MSKYKVQGISFPDEELFVAAIRKAKSQRRSLSNYICGLLEADLKNSGPALHEGPDATAPNEDFNSKAVAVANEMIPRAGGKLYRLRRPSKKRPARPPAAPVQPVKS
jgi:hypothetical protein